MLLLLLLLLLQVHVSLFVVGALLARTLSTRHGARGLVSSLLQHSFCMLHVLLCLLLLCLGLSSCPM